MKGSRPGWCAEEPDDGQKGRMRPPGKKAEWARRTWDLNVCKPACLQSRRGAQAAQASCTEPPFAQAGSLLQVRSKVAGSGTGRSLKSRENEQEMFIERSEQGGRYVSVSVLLADCDPPGDLKNALLRIRAEKIKRSRMEGVRHTEIPRLSRYGGPEKVGKRAREILSRTSTDEMMEETTLFSNGETIQSIAGEPVPGR